MSGEKSDQNADIELLSLFEKLSEVANAKGKIEEKPVRVVQETDRNNSIPDNRESGLSEEEYRQFERKRGAKFREYEEKFGIAKAMRKKRQLSASTANNEDSVPVSSKSCSIVEYHRQVDEFLKKMSTNPGKSCGSTGNRFRARSPDRHRNHRESQNRSSGRGREIISLEGAEFISPWRGFHCSLCELLFDESESVYVHVRSGDHLKVYKEYMANNPQYLNNKKADEGSLPPMKSEPFGCVPNTGHQNPVIGQKFQQWIAPKSQN